MNPKRLVAGAILVAAALSAAGRPRLLRLLRRQGRHQALQPGLAGRARARRGPHRPHHGQRLPGRPEGVRDRHPGADRAREGADPRGRARADRAPRRLLRAAARRVLRRQPVRAPAANGGGPGRRGPGCVASRPAERRQPRGHDRGPVHGRRVRHPDPVRHAEQRARDLAPRERLPHPGGGDRGPRQLHQAEHEVLRRQGEPEGAGEARLHLPAPAPDGLRVAQVHAADPAGHGERRRPAGAVRLRAHPQGPRRDDELPDGEAPHRHGPAAST